MSLGCPLKKCNNSDISNCYGDHNSAYTFAAWDIKSKIDKDKVNQTPIHDGNFLRYTAALLPELLYKKPSVTHHNDGNRQVCDTERQSFESRRGSSRLSSKLNVFWIVNFYCPILSSYFILLYKIFTVEEKC